MSCTFRYCFQLSILSLISQSFLFGYFISTYDIDTVWQTTHVVGGPYAYTLKGIDGLWAIAGYGKANARRCVAIIAQIDGLEIDGLSACGPESCYVDMGGVDIVVELSTLVVFICLQVLQVDDNLCIAA